MDSDLDPSVGKWYRYAGEEEAFRVVAVEDDVIQIQHFDGDVEEIDVDEWSDMELEAAETPETWEGEDDDSEEWGEDDADDVDEDDDSDDWDEDEDEEDDSEKPYEESDS